MRLDENGFFSAFALMGVSRIGNDRGDCGMIACSYFARRIRKVRKQALACCVKRFLADLLKERPPDLGHGQAVKTGKPEGGSEGDLSFVLLDLVQSRNGKTGPLRDLSQG
jgi:hypothetical protein